MSSIIDSNHISIQSSHIVEEICHDFFLKTGISYFTYAKQMSDGTRFSLTTNAKQAEYFVNKQYFRNIVFSDPLHKRIEYWLWNSLPFSESLNEQATLFNISNGFTIIKPSEHGDEYFYFGAKPHEHFMNNFYINNMELLHQFTLYFKEKARKLITKSSAYHNRILLPKELMESSASNPEFNKIRNYSHQKPLILDSVTIDKQGTKLSKREIECAILLTKNQTAKQIAQTLDISFRTVEVHIQNIKYKMDCQSKICLLKKLMALGFDKF
jgi:LuxR family quorum-sensing system transcriptional regulator SolR